MQGAASSQNAANVAVVLPGFGPGLHLALIGDPKLETDMSGSGHPLLPHATRDLARFAAGLEFEAIPRDVVDWIKISVLAFDRQILHRRGSPENPLRTADIVAIFRAITRGGLTPAHSERTIELVGRLETLSSLDALIVIYAASPAA